MDRAPAISALLGAHRAPLRLLFAALDARQRGALREEGGDDFTFFHGYFPQAPGGPSPLGWPAAARAAISKTVVLDAATAWGGGGYNARQRARGALPGGNVEGEGVVDWAGFLDFFVEWASPSGLRALLRDVARECCAVVAASAAPRLRAPWRTISDDELRDVLCTAFHELRHAPQTPRAAGRGFLVEDAYALCRDAAVLGDTLSPSALLTAFEASAQAQDKEGDRVLELDVCSFAVFIQKVCVLWWRGEGGSAAGPKASSFAPAQCFLVERVLPLLAATPNRKWQQSRPDATSERPSVPVDGPALAVVRDHDMALRCLFVAYCSPTSSTVPLVALLRFARDFRLLTAARFSPAAVVDCARAARHANYVSGEATSLRWPEFVETLVLLSSERSEARADSLADALKALLVLMDPGGRVFVEPRTCTDAPATDDPLDRRRGKASPNRRNEYFVDDNRIGERQASSGPRRRRDGDSLSPNKGDRRDGDRRDGDRRDDRREGDRRDRRADDRRESDRRESERLSEERAMKDRDGGDEAPHTRRRAGGDAPAPQPPEDDWMFAAQRLARAEETRRCLAEAAESTRRAATKSDSADLRQIADGVSRAAEGMLLKLRAPVRAVAAPPPAEPAPSPLPGEEWPPPPRRSPDEIWDKPDAPAPQPIHPDELRRRRAEMQAEAEASLDAADDEDPWWWVSRTFDGTTAARHVAATFLQRLARGAMLRIRLALLRARLLRGGVSAPRRSNGSAASPGPVPPIVVAPATSDERAVIHAFALAALIGDGSPRRIARAKVLVETLRQLPEVPGGGAAQLQGALRPMLPRRPPSLEELEDDLRDALARASIEENRGADSSQARLTADACAAAVRAHPGFEARAASDHALFEQDERQANVNALAHMRSLVPKDVAATDKAGVTADLALALGVPAEAPRLRALATRIWAERSLWLVHADAASTAKAHVADLRSRYGYHKLDVVELRAVYAALPMEFENDADGAKMEWREELRQRLVEAVGDERGVPRRHAAYAILSGDRQVDRMPVDRMPLPSPVAGDDDDDDDKRTAIDTGLSIRTEASGTEWRECFDDHYERVYFFNTRTGDSRWTAPDEFRPLSRPPNEAPPGSVPPDLNRLLAQQPALAAAAAHAGRV